MIAAWISAGAQIGITAFFAVIVFCLMCIAGLAVFGFLALIAKWIGGSDGEI